ncbi:MAG: methylmalonyl-CoA epimerase [Ignavibacteria bacterium]|nr:methylmalonyl-CoA epimerase [Ignavibacteria bacterium]
MVSKVAHIGIAVKDIAASAELFSKLLGKGMDHTEDVPDQKIRAVTFQVGESSIELTQGTEPDSPIAKFIEKRGEGMHHLSLVVDDIERELARLKAQGFQLIDEKPRLGADGYYIAFLHPRSTNGVLIELSQKKS